MTQLNLLDASVLILFYHYSFNDANMLNNHELNSEKKHVPLQKVLNRVTRNS